MIKEKEKKVENEEKKLINKQNENDKLYNDLLKNLKS